MYTPTYKRDELRITSRSLLVIDDNDDFITLVKLFLELDTDWKIITALDGKEGITKARLSQPDLILIDVVMPDLDGIGVYQILKSDSATCSIPAILFTAMLGAKKKVQSEVGEDVEVITKPIGIISLKNQINDLFNRYLSLKV